MTAASSTASTTTTVVKFNAIEEDQPLLGRPPEPTVKFGPHTVHRARAAPTSSTPPDLFKIDG